MTADQAAPAVIEAHVRADRTMPPELAGAIADLIRVTHANHTPAPLRLGSVCTGYAGLDMAVSAVLDVEPAWVADPDPGAAAILAHHYPDVPNLGDITAVDWAAVEPIDVLAAGFPCQDISYAGRGAGIREGNRSGLWHVIADALGVLRPGLFIAENVAAITVRRPGLDVVLADLAALGFDAFWTCVRASDVGAPHRRERRFLVAHPDDERGDRAAAQHGAHRRPVPAGDAAADAQGPRRQGPRPQPAGRGPERGRQSPPDAPRFGHGHARAEAVGGVATATVGGPAAHSASDGRDEGRPESARIVRRPDAALGGDADVDWGAYGAAVDRWAAVLGRPAPHPTESGRDGRPRLSPLFVEWLMGLPDGWVTGVPGLTRNQQLKALGNGVVWQQGAAAIAGLLDRMDAAA